MCSSGHHFLSLLNSLFETTPTEINTYDQLFDNNTLNVHHLQIEKEFKKLNKRKNSAHNSAETIYLNVNSLHAKSSKSGSSATSMNKIDKLTVNASGAPNGGYETENEAFSDSASAKNRKLVVDLSPRPTAKSKFIRVHIDVSVEKLQQNLQGHLLTLNIKNLHVEPLMEINHIKAKLGYLKIELVNNDNSDGQLRNGSNSDEPANNVKSSAAKFTTNARTFVKLNRFKERKCKFDRNLKNFAKPIDFELSKDHFIFVSEEAVRAQMRKLNIKMDDLGDDGASDRTVYLFLFWIELHSYLPVSRKTLSSTFRKQKRVFKGECQIYENFINLTQFPKTFIANEV